MIVAGVYITWFWVTELSSDGSGSTVAERLVDGWSGNLTRFLEDNAWVVAFLLAGVIVSAVVSQLWRPTGADAGHISQVRYSRDD
jgi:hypothetical protein